MLSYKMPFLKKNDNKQVSDSIMLRTLLSEFNRSLMLIADKDLLVTNTISKIRQITSVSKIIFYLFQPDTDQFRHIKNQSDVSDESVQPVFTHHSRLVNWLSVNETPLIVPQSQEIMAKNIWKNRKPLKKNLA